MSKALVITSVFVAALSGVALAQQGFSAWGHDFSISGGTPISGHQAQIVVATDKKTGRKFNCIRLENGKMMAIVPFNSLKGMPEVSEEDMIHS
ncbi:protein of unknown function; putative exported protein [Methylorubrum extorquens DM4]|uniref:Transcriptional regulator n=1 Tax=Methylorubrum extorquens (strain DSM 6343 / CIP 106787 / DM4) TaxID=661410 RepID=C7CFV6_METED|nr:hypothetical protein [Methylorubrum extorquens]CAX23032.1 protein of unknown function; putative exported protein [Methylorubrum extorquens DM4]